MEKKDIKFLNLYMTRAQLEEMLLKDVKINGLDENEELVLVNVKYNKESMEVDFDFAAIDKNEKDKLKNDSEYIKIRKIFLDFVGRGIIPRSRL